MLLIVTKIIRIMWVIGVIYVTFVNLVNMLNIFNTFDLSSLPTIFSLIPLLALFVFLDIGFWMSMAQMCGNFYVKIANMSKMPSKNNYECKVDYILPFTGKWTVFNGGVDVGTSHSWGIVPQRYAYDFIIMDDEGKSFAGDNNSLKSYYCYGKDIIAPADGVVVKVSNKHKDSRVSGAKVYCDAWDIRGNFVVIKHADKEFSVSAHLVPDSITVRKGDKVKQGQIIAKCGNSGNTSEPHLHFQLQSGKSFFSSAGLPISFINIDAQEKANYGLADSRSSQKEAQKADGNEKVYIGRGLEVVNAPEYNPDELINSDLIITLS